MLRLDVRSKWVVVEVVFGVPLILLRILLHVGLLCCGIKGLNFLRLFLTLGFLRQRYLFGWFVWMGSEGWILRYWVNVC